MRRAEWGTTHLQRSNWHKPLCRSTLSKNMLVTEAWEWNGYKRSFYCGGIFLLFSSSRSYLLLTTQKSRRAKKKFHNAMSLQEKSCPLSRQSEREYYCSHIRWYIVQYCLFKTSLRWPNLGDTRNVPSITGGHFACACVNLLNDNSVGASNLMAGNRKLARKVTVLLKAISLVLWIPYFPTKNILHDKNRTFSTRVFTCRFFSSRFSWPFKDFQDSTPKSHVPV